MTSIDAITEKIIGSAMRIHSAVGPGLFESVYEMILARDLTRLGFQVERQKPVSFEFEGMRFDDAFRADLVVQGLVIVEIKAVAALAPIHSRQLLTYLRLLKCPAGLLLNFSSLHLRDGIARVANSRPSVSSASSA